MTSPSNAGAATCAAKRLSWVHLRRSPAALLTACREIVKYLNRKDVQELLGVEVSKYEPCSDTVRQDFSLTLDMAKGAKDYVSALLERDVRVLIYVGTYD
jgi:carboxypeptidase C (cathepsin A)